MPTGKGRITSHVQANTQTFLFPSQSRQLLCFSLHLLTFLQSHPLAAQLLFCYNVDFLPYFWLPLTSCRNAAGPHQLGGSSDLGKAPGLLVCCDSSFLSSFLWENQLKKNPVREKRVETGTVCASSALSVSLIPSWERWHKKVLPTKMSLC